MVVPKSLKLQVMVRFHVSQPFIRYPYNEINRLICLWPIVYGAEIDKYTEFLIKLYPDVVPKVGDSPWKRDYAGSSPVIRTNL